MKPFIQVQDAEMVFTTRKGRFHALQNVNLDVQRGEFITLIGTRAAASPRCST